MTGMNSIINYQGNSLPSLTATNSKSQMIICNPYLCTAVHFLSISTNGSQQSIPAFPCVNNSTKDCTWQQNTVHQLLLKFPLNIQYFKVITLNTTTICHAANNITTLMLK